MRGLRSRSPISSDIKGPNDSSPVKPHTKTQMIIVHHAAARLHTWIRSLDTREYEYLKRTPVIEEIWLDVIERLVCVIIRKNLVRIITMGAKRREFYMKT